MTVIYIHGFNSSPRSFKAGLIATRMSELGCEADFVCPELPHTPGHAIDALDALVGSLRSDGPALIGSSLGGYYATWLAERYGIPAVLVNPAVRPYSLLAHALGRQKNLYTGVEYELTLNHLEELRELEVLAPTAARYLLITCTGDEVLDFREGVRKYAGAQQLVVDGGDHGFADFARYVDRALGFCGVLEQVGARHAE